MRISKKRTLGLEFFLCFLYLVSYFSLVSIFNYCNEPDAIVTVVVHQAYKKL